MKLIAVTVFLLLSVTAFAADVPVEVAAPTILSVVFGCLYAVSEVIGTIPSIKDNTVYGIIYSILKALVGKS